MADGIIDSAEDMAKKAAKAVLPDSWYDELKKDYHTVVDPIRKVEKVYHDVSSGDMGALAGDVFNSGGSNNAPQNNGTPDSSQQPSGIDTGGSWWSKVKHFFGLDQQPQQQDSGQQSSGTGDDSSGGALGGLGGLLGSFLKNPLGAIIGLFLAIITGIGSLLNSFGLGNDDTPSGDVGERIIKATESGAQTFDAMKNEKGSTLFRDAAKRIGDEARAFTEGAKNDYNSATVSAKELYATGYLVHKGWTIEQASGIVANLKVESAGLNSQAVGDNGQAFGLGQWHPDRQAEYKRVFGKDIRQASFTEQLDFVDYEMRHGNEQAAGRKIMATDSTEQAARDCCAYYERPGDIPGQSRLRAETASNILTAYNSQMSGHQQLDGGVEVASTPRTSPTLPQTSLDFVKSASIG